MNIRKTLEYLGYKPHEIQVYLAVLIVGGCTTAELARKTQLPRSTVQITLEQLGRTGLITTYLKRRRKIWVCENPEKLIEKLEDQETAIRAVLPKLKALSIGYSQDVHIRLFEGAGEIKQIMDDIIESKHHILSIVSWDEWVQLFGKEYVDEFIARRVTHFLKIRIITPKTELAAQIKKLDEQELRHTKFLPHEIFIHNSNFIYSDKVAIISLNKKQPLGIVIEDPDIRNTMSILFESLWKDCQEL